MNMNEVNNFSLEKAGERESNVLTNLLEKNGSCAMNGYLGETNIKFTIDNNGVFEFATTNQLENNETKSQGAILSDGVVIKQVQKTDRSSYNQLYAWNIDDNSYTYIVFDNNSSLDDCYEKTKAMDINLAKEDLSSKFAEMGISFDNVAQVLLNQKVDSVSSMVEEATREVVDDTSFVL